MIKKQALYIVATLIITLNLSSCSKLLYTNIDVLRPAKISFPIETDNILILNNSLPQTPTYGHTNELFDNTQKEIQIKTDSLSIFALASFAEGMADKEFFNRITLLHESIKAGDNFLSVDYPDKSKIQELAEQEDAEAVIVLNRLLVSDKLGELYDPEYARYYAYLEAIYDYVWSVHFPDNHQIMTFNAKDTVYWEAEAYARQRALQSMPDRKNALIDGALISGDRMVDKFIPFWQEVDRYLFNFQNKKMKIGMAAFYEKKWGEAIDSWNSLLNSSKNKAIKIKTAHNLAVTHEIIGELEQAYQYSQQAIEVFMDMLLIDYRTLEIIMDYNEALKLRMQELEQINKQLGK